MDNKEQRKKEYNQLMQDFLTYFSDHMPETTNENTIEVLAVISGVACALLGYGIDGICTSNTKKAAFFKSFLVSLQMTCPTLQIVMECDQDESKH